MSQGPGEDRVGEQCSGDYCWGPVFQMGWMLQLLKDTLQGELQGIWKKLLGLAVPEVLRA